MTSISPFSHFSLSHSFRGSRVIPTEKQQKAAAVAAASFRCMEKKSFLSSSKILQCCRFATDIVRPSSSSKATSSPASSSALTSGALTKTTKRKMESGEEVEKLTLPLSEVVSDCVRRWFHDTLKEAKGGDSAMQMLVGQMYNSGYGVRRNPQKVVFFSFYNSFKGLSILNSWWFPIEFFVP